MPQETKSAPPALKNAQQDTEPSSLHGWTIDAKTNPEQLITALEKAFDYRGDVTITLKATSPETPPTEITGYIFDRKTTNDTQTSNVRILTPDTNTPKTIPYADITRIAFTGKDTAHGKSFETWIQRFTEKRLSPPSTPIQNQ